jgi:hypothetical protein
MRRALALLALVAAPAAAQGPAAGARRDTIAFPGAAGVYVWTGGTVVSPEHPLSGVVGHRVERRRPGAADWERVADVSAVASENDFFGGLDPVTRAAVVRALRQKTEPAAWQYILAHPRADSLGRILGDERIRLALGAYALDQRVKPGETWEYRVSNLDARGTATSPVLSAPVPYPAAVRFAPVRVLRVEQSESTVVVWFHVTASGGLPARSLEIWRRRGRDGGFAKVDSLNSMIRVKDSTLARYEGHRLGAGELYQYYAVPRDVFFNTGTPSDTVTTYTVSATRFTLPDSLRAVSVDSLGVVVTWRFADARLARAIRVYRSPAQDTGWRQVAELPAGARRFVDQQAPEMRMTYYRLTVTGPRNEESPPTASTFGFFRSRVPPAPPYGLVAAPGPGNRGIRLTWQRNGDPGLRGYVVFRAPRAVDSIGPDTPLEQIGPLLEGDTTYLDTLSAVSPGREYAYVVQAVSRSELRSAYSSPVFFSPPERGGLSAPTGLRGVVDGNRVELFWDDMSGLDLGTAGYVVERRTAGSPDSAFALVTAAALGRTQNTFVDSSVAAGRAYEYVVRSVDRGRGQSPRSLPARVAVPVVRPPAPGGVRAVAAADGIAVSWGEIEGLTATVRIYRYARGGRPARLGEVGATDSGYVDRTAQPGQRYYYYTTLVVRGVESLPSAEVTARR